MPTRRLLMLAVRAAVGIALAADSRGAAQDAPLPSGALWRQGATRLRHPGGINSLAFAPDGKVLASGGFDGAVRLWDAATGKEAAFFYPSPYDWRIYRVVFAPDGQTLAVGSGSGIVLYDVAGRRVRRRFEGEAMVVSFSRDSRLVAGSGSSVTLWDAATGKKVLQTPADNRAIYGMTVAPDGKSLVYAHTNPQNRPGETDLFFWDVAAGRETRRLPGPKDWIHALAFSPDGATLAAAAHSEVLIVDTATWTERFRLKKTVYDLAFCPKTQRLAVARDHAIELCSTATGKIEKTLGEQPADLKRRVAVAPDGATLATSGSDGRIRLWDIATGQEKLPQPDLIDPVKGLAFSADGKTVASCFNDGRVQLLDATTGAPGKQLAGRDEHPDWFDSNRRSLVFSRDGRLLICGDQRGRIRVWDAAAGKELHCWQTDTAVQVDVTRDGRTLVASGRALKLWDLADAKQARALSYAGQSGDFSLLIGSPAFSPDGKRVAAVFKPFRPLSGGLKLVDDLPPPPPASIQIWDAASGKPVADEGIRDAQLRDARQLLFLDDVTLATAGDPILVWDLSGQVGPRRFVQLPDSQCGVMAHSRDGRWLAAAYVVHGKDGTPVAKQHVVCVWETASGTIAWRRASHRGTIAAVAFAPDGRRLVSGSTDATVVLWDLALAEEQVAGVPRALSPAELDALWHDLADPDAAGAYAALRALESRPEQALAILGAKLRADPPLPIGQWMSDLQAEEFATRDKAHHALMGLGREAVTHLLGVDNNKLTLEGQRRRQLLLRYLAQRPFTPEQLRRIRAVAVLERHGTPTAREVLNVLAQGRPGSVQTEHAKVARARLKE